jgi:AraC-like DNA-binding protein
MKPSYEMVPTPPEQSWLLRNFDQLKVIFDWHVHDEFELVLMHEGHGQYFVGDSINVFGPDELVLFGSQLPHTFKSDPGVQRIFQTVIQFKADSLDSNLLHQPEFYKLRKMLQRSASGIRFEQELALQLRSRILKIGQLSPGHRTVELLSILVVLADSTGQNLSHSDSFPSSSSKTKERLRRVVEFIEANLAEEVTLDRVAAVALMSPTAFSRFFHQEMGTTLTDYVNDMRIGAAKGRLRENDSSIALIAKQVGYNNISNFNRQFRARSNMSPREFVAQFRK